VSARTSCRRSTGTFSLANKHKCHPAIEGGNWDKCEKEILWRKKEVKKDERKEISS
jgi:hypothetical protein